MKHCFLLLLGWVCIHFLVKGLLNLLVIGIIRGSKHSIAASLQLAAFAPEMGDVDLSSQDAQTEIESGIGDYLSNWTNWIDAMISLRLIYVIALRLHFVFDDCGDYCAWNCFANRNYNTGRQWFRSTESARRGDNYTISNELYSLVIWQTTTQITSYYPGTSSGDSWSFDQYPAHETCKNRGRYIWTRSIRCNLWVVCFYCILCFNGNWCKNSCIL